MSRGILCCRPHYLLYDSTERYVYHATLGGWLLCGLVQKPLLMTVLFALGVIDAEADCAPLYWRWPFGPASEFRRIALDGLRRRIVYEWRRS